MTEREILNGLIEQWKRCQKGQNHAFGLAMMDAMRRLAETEPKPEHPAVVAYREWWDDSDPPMDQAFLAGWKRALEHEAKEWLRVWNNEYDGENVAAVLKINAKNTPDKLP